MRHLALVFLLAPFACTPSSDNVGDVEDTSTTEASTTASSMSSTTAGGTTSNTTAVTSDDGSGSTTSNTTAMTSDDDGSGSSGSNDSTTVGQDCEAITGSMDCQALAEVSPDLTLEECQMCQGIACGTVEMCDSQYPCIDDAIALIGCCEDADCDGISNFCGMFTGTNNICVLDDNI